MKIDREKFLAAALVACALCSQACIVEEPARNPNAPPPGAPPPNAAGQPPPPGAPAPAPAPEPSPGIRRPRALRLEASSFRPAFSRRPGGNRRQDGLRPRGGPRPRVRVGRRRRRPLANSRFSDLALLRWSWPAHCLAFRKGACLRVERWDLRFALRSSLVPRMSSVPSRGGTQNSGRRPFPFLRAYDRARALDRSCSSRF
jgi:hypothetical protein